MTDIFLKLLDMSLSASWIVLAVITTRLVLKKAPRWMICALWALVALRLVCPFSFESALSLIPEVDIPREVLTSAEDVLSGDSAAGHSYSTEAAPEDQQAPIEGRSYGAILSSEGETLVIKVLEEPEPTRNRYLLFSILWLVGMGLMCLYAAASYLHIRRKVQVSIDLGNGVFLCDYIDTPFILGIVRPKIYLPSDMDPADASHVLAHERAHLKRKDHWWKPLGFALLSIHWFNPLLWIAYILLCRDIELACDERVIRDFCSTEKKAYSEALLKCSVPRHMILACPLAFGEVGVKQRVRSVLHYKKPGFWVLLITVILIAVIAVCFLTDPQSNTLSDLCPVSQENVSTIRLQNDTGYVILQTDKELSAAWALLEDAVYDPQPIHTETAWDPCDENGLGFHQIDFIYGEERRILYFHRDFSAVCIEDSTGTLNHHTVSEPEALEAFFETYIDPVDRREITAEPFATADVPWKWMQGIRMGAIKSARIGYYEEPTSENLAKTYHHYITSDTRLQELLDILNSVPEDAVISGPTYMEEAISHEVYTVETGNPHMCVTIQDGANEMGVVLRYWEDAGDHLELVTFDNPEALEPGGGKSFTNLRTWELHSDELVEYMKELIAARPRLATFNGWWMEPSEEPVTVDNGIARIKLYPPEGWEYEVATLEEEHISFGIRIRPVGEEGWVYYSYWPRGFTDTFPDSRVDTYSGNEYIYTSICYPATNLNPDRYYEKDSVWYYKQYRISSEYGDYVVVNEDARLHGPEYSWIPKYEEELEALELRWISFQFLNPSDVFSISNFCTWDRSTVSCIDLVNDKGIACMNSPEEQEALWALLEEVTYDPQPHTSVGGFWTPQDENGNAYFRMNFTSGEETHTLYFYPDFSSICWEDAEGDLRHYTIQEPELLQEFFAGQISVVDPHRKITAEPFATREDPYGWMQGITRDAMASASLRYYTDGHGTGSNMSTASLETLLELLKTIPKDALSGPETLEEGSAGQITYVQSSKPNMAVHIRDAANDLGVILRYHEAADTPCMEIIMVEGAETLSASYAKKITQAQKWRIENDALLAYMKQLAEYPQTVTMFSGYWLEMEERPIVLSDGQGQISIRLIKGWEHEIVSPGSGGESFGVRIRPPEETEGWIYYSFWPGGYEPNEVNRYYCATGSVYNGYRSYPITVCDPSGFSPENAVWSYTRYFAEYGDFLILNEGADDWLPEYMEHLNIQENHVAFDGGETVEGVIPTSEIDLHYTQSDDPDRGFHFIQFDTADKAGMNMGTGWMSDDTPVVKDDHTVLCSFWPEYETEGKVVVEYWEGFFQPEESMTVEEVKLGYGGAYTGYTGNLPGEDRWTYLWIHREFGSYVFRCENTDHWNERKMECVLTEIGEIQFTH